MGHFSVFLCIEAKPFIKAHHGFYHSVGKGLKYLRYQGYIYTHSPLRGSQLSPKKPQKQYFSRLSQKVDFVRLFSRSMLKLKLRCTDVRQWASLLTFPIDHTKMIMIAISIRGRPIGAFYRSHEGVLRSNSLLEVVLCESLRRSLSKERHLNFSRAEKFVINFFKLDQFT